MVEKELSEDVGKLARAPWGRGAGAPSNPLDPPLSATAPARLDPVQLAVVHLNRHPVTWDTTIPVGCIAI